MSAISEQARKQANLRLLQRTCSRDINDVVQTATHVVLYEFVCDAWQKSNVEGSMFLTQTPTAYHLVILNRHSTENLQMEVTDSMQMQNQDPYLIFKERVGDATRIRGIWFHNADERIAMANALQRSIERLRMGSLPPVPTTPAGIAATPSPAPRPPPSSSSKRASPLTSSVASPPEPSSSPGAAALTSLLSSMAVSSTEPTTGASSSPLPHACASASSPSASSPSSSTPPGSGGVALDKKSLQLALLSLIQDDRFLDLLHSQYLRVVHARIKKQQQEHNQHEGGSS